MTHNYDVAHGQRSKQPLQSIGWDEIRFHYYTDCCTYSTILCIFFLHATEGQRSNYFARISFGLLFVNTILSCRYLSVERTKQERLTL